MEENETQNPNSDLTDEQIDNLVAETEQPTNQDIPMTAPPKEEAKTEAELLFEFQHNGKQIKANRDQMLKYAQMGYDYPQKMAKFNQERSMFDQERQAFTEQQKQYMQINEWAQKNPDKWAQVEQLYRQQIQGQQGVNQPDNPSFVRYEQELGEIKNFLNELKTEREQTFRKSQDEKLSEEMKSIRDTYKDLDFDTPNEEGKSLDYQVLGYAKNNGIRSYKTAFHDMYHDKLIARAEALAKQQVSKGIQANTKMGVLGKNPTQTKPYQEPKSVKELSYEDLAQEALAELRASS